MDEITVRTCAQPASTPGAATAAWVSGHWSWATRGLRSARRVVGGSAAAIASTAVLSVLMLPLRGHLEIEAAALVLVVPVVLGAEIGGLTAGAVAMAAGVVAFDFVFLPPYFAVSLGEAEDWVLLLVYAMAMTVTVRVVVRMHAATGKARRSESEVRRLFTVSEMLVRESSAEELLVTIVTAIVRAFDLDGAALLLPVEDRLEVVASFGRELSEEERRRLCLGQVAPIAVGSGPRSPAGLQVVPLVASGEAIGMLAVRGLGKEAGNNDLVRTFANHLAIALERTRLRATAVRAQLLEEIDRTRQSLVGAVSHDFRTPLTAIKLSASTLLDLEALDGSDVAELIQLIEWQADRLNRMVSSVFDMSRLQSGTLELRRQVVSLEDLVIDALAALGPCTELERVSFETPLGLPPVEVDRMLICQVLANLIDNATRCGPPASPVTVLARQGIGNSIEVSVTDEGAAVPAEERKTIFSMFHGGGTGGRGGLGLAVAHAFVEAHGQQIWVESDERGRSRFCFTLPSPAQVEVA